jgi:chromosome segregation ATPase
MNKRQQINTHLERVDAQLVSLAGSLEGALTEIMRLQALGVDQVKNHRDKLENSLRQMTLELQNFENEDYSSLTNGSLG